MDERANEFGCSDRCPLQPLPAQLDSENFLPMNPFLATKRSHVLHYRLVLLSAGCFGLGCGALVTRLYVSKERDDGREGDTGRPPQGGRPQP